MKTKTCLGGMLVIVATLLLHGGVANGEGNGGIFTADIEMTLPDWYDGNPFMATINPDSQVPEELKSFSGTFSGPAWDPSSVILSGLPVYAINAFGYDEWEGPPTPNEAAELMYPENAAWGESLYQVWTDESHEELYTDFNVRHFGWTKVGELSLFGTAMDGGAFQASGTFSDVFGHAYPVQGSIGLYFPGPDWSAGPNDWLWIGVGNIDLSGAGLVIQSGDERWWDNPVVLQNDEWPDVWQVEGVNGWPGATLDKFFFGGGSFDVNLWTPKGDANLTRVVEGFASGDYSIQGLNGAPLADTIDVENVVLEDGMWTLAVGYSPTELNALGIDEETLRLYWWDEETEQWLAAGNESNLLDNSGNPDYTGFVLGTPTDVLGDWGVDTANHLVWANLDHGSTFCITGVPEPNMLFLLITACVMLAAGRSRRRM